MDRLIDRRAAIESLFARFAEGDLTAPLALLDARVVLVIGEEIPDAGTYFGLAGVRDYMTRFLEPWKTLTMAARSLREVGDTVVVEVEQRGVGRSSQATAELRYVQMWTFRGPRVIHIEVTFDQSRVTELLGS